MTKGLHNAYAPSSKVRKKRAKQWKIQWIYTPLHHQQIFHRLL